MATPMSVKVNWSVSLQVLAMASEVVVVELAAAGASPFAKESSDHPKTLIKTKKTTHKHFISFLFLSSNDPGLLKRQAHSFLDPTGEALAEVLAELDEVG